VTRQAHALLTDDGGLCLDGISFATLAAKLGTPFFVFSESRLRSNLAALEHGLTRDGRRPTIRYCAKTNNESGILETLASAGGQVLVSHPAEARLAIQAGYSPEDVAYHCPVLQDAELETVLACGVRQVHVCSADQLALLESVAARARRPVQVTLRLSVGSLLARLSPLALAAARFGFSVRAVPSATEQFSRSPWLRLRALHFHVGTQQTSIAPYRAALRRTLRLAAQLRRAGTAIEEINLGGGVPSPSLRRVEGRTLWAALGASAQPLDDPTALETYARRLGHCFCEEAERAGVPALAIGLEPGRSVVGDAGFLVTRICALAGRWAHLDASRNYLGEPFFLFRRRILLARAPLAAGRRCYHLSGRTLNTTDVIDVARPLPPLAADDLLVLGDAGAYSISRSSSYAGLRPPVYLLRVDGSLCRIRRAEELADLRGPMSAEVVDV
jgi:diaminopimelate decarboxylase